MATVHLWVMDISRLSRQSVEVAKTLLTEPELRRLDNLASASAQETFTLGHSLTRLVVGREFHVPATAVRIAQFCETCGGAHGRPSIEGLPIHVSIAHSGGVVAVATARNSEIAVDCEEFPPRAHNLESLGILLSARADQIDQRFAVTRWTVHECLVKLGRRGLGEVTPLHFNYRRNMDDLMIAEDVYFRSVLVSDAVVTVGVLEPFRLIVQSGQFLFES